MKPHQPLPYYHLSLVSIFLPTTATTYIPNIKISPSISRFLRSLLNNTTLYFSHRRKQHRCTLTNTSFYYTNNNISLNLRRQPGKRGIFSCFHEIRAAFAFSPAMTDNPYRVSTTSRLAQWRIDSFASSSYRKSDPFKIGNWNWRLVVEKNRTLFIKLYPEISSLNKTSPPIASFTIQVVCSLGGRTALVHPEIRDKQLKSSEDFIWALEVPLGGKFIIDVEFLDLKTASPNGGESCSVWTEGFTQKDLHVTALSSLGKMLSESIHTDIIINASDGTVGAHRAILAARSPVFSNMFSHDLQEKEMSVINISDMSIEACQAFLSYIYGNITDQDFLTHRLDLLQAADKYDVTDLKEACHQSLLEDIDTNNVLQRLQIASLYHLPKLKTCCMQYLVRFGKIFDILEEFTEFIQSADRELIGEVFGEVLSIWKGF